MVQGSPRPPYIGHRMRSVPRLLVGYDLEKLQLLPYPVDLLSLNPLMSCLVRQVLMSFWIRSSGESSGRSSGGRVGCQLGRLGPLTGRRVFW
jgi:hypothetical protein